MSALTLVESNFSSRLKVYRPLTSCSISALETVSKSKYDQDSMYSQLCVDKGAAVSSLNRTPDESIDPLDQVIGVSRRRVSPVAVLLSVFLLGRGNVDSAKLGVHDWCAGLVLCTLLDARDGRHKHVAAGLLARDEVEAGACLFELWAIAVVVEGCEVSDDVLPAAVVVDASGVIKTPVYV